MGISLDLNINDDTLAICHFHTTFHTPQKGEEHEEQPRYRNLEIRNHRRMFGFRECLKRGGKRIIVQLFVLRGAKVPAFKPTRILNATE